MPSNIVKSFAKQTGKSIVDVEKMWKDSIEIVKKQYTNIEPESEEFYKLVVGVLKKMLKIESTAGTTTANIGGTTDGQPDPDAYIFKDKIGKDVKKRDKTSWQKYLSQYDIQ